ncbi:unnamed protein product [marine sediment metagenome]|uniref:Uncharacterized protein n=1 Tax=marine sediment metagenome TaxID=412755 RepID=X1ITW4_9ZZZZ
MDFPLGGGYEPGAYNVRSFPEFDLGAIRTAEEEREREEKITKEQLQDPTKRITKEQLTAPEGGGEGGDGKKEVIRNGAVAPSGTVAPKTALDEILDIVPKTEPLPPTGLPPTGLPSPELPPPPDAGPRPVGMPPAGGEQEMLSQLLKSILSPSQMPAVSPGMMPFSPVNVPPAADVLPPEAQPVSAIQQLLTQPLTQPFREGMTGNYPVKGEMYKLRR